MSQNILQCQRVIPVLSSIFFICFWILFHDSAALTEGLLQVFVTLDFSYFFARISNFKVNVLRILDFYMTIFVTVFGFYFSDSDFK